MAYFGWWGLGRVARSRVGGQVEGQLRPLVFVLRKEKELYYEKTCIK